MASKNEIVARAEAIARGKGVDPHQSPAIDSGMTAEALIPHAMAYAIDRALESGGAVEDYTREVVIPLTGGIGELPESVIQKYLPHSHVTGEPYTSFVRNPADIYRSRHDALLYYYTVRGQRVEYTKTGAPTLDLNCVALPDVPGDADTDLGVSDTLCDDTVAVIASVLTGEIPVSMLL